MSMRRQCGVTGFSREELIGTDFSRYFTQPDMAKMGYEKVFRDGSVTDYALEIRHRNGRITPVLYNASVYRDEGRMSSGFSPLPATSPNGNEPKTPC